MLRKSLLILLMTPTVALAQAECVKMCNEVIDKADARIKSLELALDKKDAYINKLEKDENRLRKMLSKEKEVKWYEDPVVTVPSGMFIGLLVGSLVK